MKRINKEMKKAKIGPWHKFKYVDGPEPSNKDLIGNIQKLTKEIIQQLRKRSEHIYPKGNPR